MTAWAWEAGSSCGIAGDAGRARDRAEAVLMAGEALVAVVQQVVTATGLRTLEDSLVPVAGTRVTGRRHGDGVRWGPA